MTSNPLAQSRPGPQFRPPLAPPPGLEAQPGLGITHDLEESEQIHPSKRRKIESPSQVPSTPPVLTTEDGEIVEQKREPLLQKGPWRFSLLFMAEFEKADVEPPPLTRRPWQDKILAKPITEPKATHRVRKNIPVPNTPDKIELPGDATKIGKSLAGFFPWTGKHAEDILSEPNVRHGYSDRPPNPPEKELGSAKTPLYSAFKQRSGLETLSVLYGLALERKARQGALPSSSNFRPPPRVTLTEAKRRAWLNDLANSEVPLRRLSRTIPQGIRGQSLLDQCLTNSIPISRAMWFIKCVGANEIRTLKRKGPGAAVAGGSEVKWLKEWTMFVQQFVESISQQCGQPDWKKNIQYALRLVSQLYLDNLLDRDIYLDWIVKHFTTTNHDKLPLWLMLVNANLPDMTRFRRRSRRLLGAASEKLNLARATSEDELGPLILRMKNLIRSISHTRPVCFLLPDQWRQCKETLQYSLNFDVAMERKLYEQIEKQNEKLAASPKEQCKDTTRPRQALLTQLDHVSVPFNISQILESCQRFCPNIDDMIMTILEWSTTRFRDSVPHFYLGINLLKLLHIQGHDVETMLFDFLSDLSHLRLTEPQRLHHFIAELSRSQTFSVSKLLQTMIVRGSSRRRSFADSKIVMQHVTTEGDVEIIPQTCDDISQILTEISLQQLPPHIPNLRKSVLSRAGFQPDTEAAVIDHCKQYLAVKLPMLCKSSDTFAEGTYSTPDFSLLSWTIKSDVSSWLRERIRTWCTSETRSIPVNPPRSQEIKLEHFCFIRAVLEEMNDLSILADVLEMVSTLPEEGLLASVVDTVDRHADALSAIGVFGDLQRRACQGYLLLRSTKLALPVLATSLIGLNQQHPSNSISVNILQQDFIQGDRGSAAAACSPFSDGVAESLQQAGTRFLEEFEAILQTETNMNELTMSQLFTVLTTRIEKEAQGNLDREDVLVLCQLLARLRLCRSAQSRGLIRHWIGRLLLAKNSKSTSELMESLVGSGCVHFGLIWECLKDITKDFSDIPATLQDHLNALFATHASSSDPIQYRFETDRLRYTKQKPLDALKGFAKIKSLEDYPKVPLLVRSALFGEMVSELQTVDNLSMPVRDCLRLEIDNLLHEGNDVNSTNSDVLAVVDLANDFSLPLCQLRLRLHVSTMQPESKDDIGDAFFALASRSTNLDGSESVKNSVWSSLLPAAGTDVAQYVRKCAEESFLSSLPTCLQSRSITSVFETPVNKVQEAMKYLDIAFAASETLNDPLHPTTTAQLIEKFSSLLRMLGSAANLPTTTSVVSPMAISAATPGQISTPAAPTPTSAAPPATPETMTMVAQYIPLLLRMACLHRPSNAGPAVVPLAKSAQQDQIKLVVLLSSIALHPALSATALPSHIFSVTSTLITAPTFTDEMHAYASKLLKDKLRDPRIQFLFGNVSLCGSALAKDVGEGLQLVRDGVGKVGEWKQWVRAWEVIEPSGGGEGSGWVGIGMFGATKV